jgi:hypothetical protein
MATRLVGVVAVVVVLLVIIVCVALHWLQAGLTLLLATEELELPYLCCSVNHQVTSRRYCVCSTTQAATLLLSPRRCLL